MIKTTERGWAGHYICASRCLFRRNTLVESDSEAVIVSTVGNHIDSDGETCQIGSGRFFETRAFAVRMDGPYIDADTNIMIPFDSEGDINADSADDLPGNVDNLANEMHDKVVSEFVGRFSEGSNDEC